MALTMTHMSLLIGTLGVVSFIFGVVAENKKPASGVPITGKDVIICKYPSDPSVPLGYLSVVFLVASAVAGYFSLFYPYRKKSVPQAALFRSTAFLVFFNIALMLPLQLLFAYASFSVKRATSGLALAFLLWPTITEQLHIAGNVHHNLKTDCPTAKTGLLGGGAFLSLDSALFWLVSLMLASNAREDYLDEIDGKNGLGSSLADDYDANLPKSTV